MHYANASHMKWVSTTTLTPANFNCGHCGHLVSSDTGFMLKDRDSPRIYAYIHICPGCLGPTYFDVGGEAHPGPPRGQDVRGLSPDLHALYLEARRAASAGANTACILLCRKILMHVAVNEGAEPGRPFVAYVEHLAKEGHIPPRSRKWVDYIRQQGNEANHELVVSSPADAQALLDLTASLLQILYELPTRVPDVSDAPTGNSV